MSHILFMLFVGFLIGGLIADSGVAITIGIIGAVLSAVFGISSYYVKDKRNAEQERLAAYNLYRSSEPKIQNRSFVPKGHYSLSEFLKKEALHGSLEDITVIIGETSISKYDRNSNNIYISEQDNETKDKFLDALLKCFQQAVCVQQGILYSSTPAGMRDDEISDEDLEDDSEDYDIDEYFMDEDEEDSVEDDEDEELDDSPIINMLGEEVNEKTFARMQRQMSGFFPNWSFNESDYENLKIKKRKLGTLTPDDESKLIFPLIFGNFGCEINLEQALTETNKLLNRVLNKKPVENLVRENDLYINWLHEYAIPQILLGTIYAYQKDYIKASYHFMLGLKTEQIAINMPYCDFIRYILGKLHKYASNNAEYTGCGFTANDSMGSCGGTMLIAENALKIIPEMEGINGEVIIARMGNTGMFGYLERKGSTRGETSSSMIDIYETYIIDRDYNLKKICFYFNGYFNMGRNSIKIASGFKIKAHSLLHNSAEIIYNNK